MNDGLVPSSDRGQGLDARPGRSFEKLCRKAQGTYIEFRPDVDICPTPSPTSSTSMKTSTCWCRASLRCARCSMRSKRSSTRRSRRMVPAWREYGNDLRITGPGTPSGREPSKNWRGGRPAHQGPGHHAQPLRQGRAVRALLRGQEQRRFLQRLHRHRERGVERRPTCTRWSTSCCCTWITGEMYLTATVAQGAVRRRAEAATR